MKLALHLGCGPIRMESTPDVQWVNVDQNPSPATDIVCDVVDYLYSKSQPVDYVWSCHMLEHMAYPTAVQRCLDGIHQVLKPGGILRLAVPDLKTVATAYEFGSTLQFMYGPEFKGYYHIDCPAERFHFFMHAWSHTIVFDFDLLGRRLLKDAGFTKVRQVVAGESDIPDWHYDRFESESLYVEATK